MPRWASRKFDAMFDPNAPNGGARNLQSGSYDYGGNDDGDRSCGSLSSQSPCYDTAPSGSRDSERNSCQYWGYLYGTIACAGTCGTTTTSPPLRCAAAAVAARRPRTHRHTDRPSFRRTIRRPFRRAIRRTNRHRRPRRPQSRRTLLRRRRALTCLPAPRRSRRRRPRVRLRARRRKCRCPYPLPPVAHSQRAGGDRPRASPAR